MFLHELTIISLPLTTHHICEGVTQIRQFYVALKKKRKTREKNRVWLVLVAVNTLRSIVLGEKLVINSKQIQPILAFLYNIISKLKRFSERERKLERRVGISKQKNGRVLVSPCFPFLLRASLRSRILWRAKNQRRMAEEAEPEPVLRQPGKLGFGSRSDPSFSSQLRAPAQHQGSPEL